GLAEEGLDRRLVRRLVVTGERGHDVAVPRVLLPAYDDEVAVEDPGVDHRVALHPQEELLSPARERLGDGEVLLDVLVGKEGPARRDLAQERQPVDVGRSGRRLTTTEELEGARLRRVAAQEAGALEVREVRVHR